MEDDALDLIPPVDIFPKLNATNFTELINSKKWSERIDGIKLLTDLLEAHPRLAIKERLDHRDLVGKLETILLKDTNINVCASAVKALKGLAQGLRTEFQSFAPPVVGACVEKFKEKKATLRAPLIECIDAIALTTPLSSYLDRILEGVAKANPVVREQTLLFLYRHYKQHNKRTASLMMLNELAPHLTKLASDADLDVRTAANQTIAAALRCVGLVAGEKLFFAEVMSDSGKKAKIIEECNKLIEELKDDASLAILYLFDPRSAKARTGKVAHHANNAVKENADQDGEEHEEEGAAEVDPLSLIPPVDIFPKLDATNFTELINSKKWSERIDGIKLLNDLLEMHPRLAVKDRLVYRELVGKLETILLKDTNINVCASAAKALKGLTQGLRAEFQSFAPSVVGACVEKFKEKKATLRAPLIECIDAIALTTPLSSYLDRILEGVAKANPVVREQTLLFLYRHYKQHNKRTASLMMLNELAPHLTKLASDADPDVRTAANQAIAAALRCVGLVAGEKLFFAEVMSDSGKKAKITEECDKLTEELKDTAPLPIPGVLEHRPAKARTGKVAQHANNAEKENSNQDREERKEVGAAKVDPLSLVPPVGIKCSRVGNLLPLAPGSSIPRLVRK